MANPNYPATDLNTGLKLFIPVSNQIHDIVNGTASQEVTTDSGKIPSIRKMLVDNIAFKAEVLPWTNGDNETDFRQLRLFAGVQYFSGTATDTNPIPMGTTPIGDTNWAIAPTNFNQELFRGDIDSIVGGKVYPRGRDLVVGDTIPSEAEPYTRVRVDGKIYAMSPVASGLVADLTNNGATIGRVGVVFKPMQADYMTVYVNAEGLGGIVDDTSAFQEAIDAASALQYIKRGVRVVARTPVNYYQISAPLRFNELWNVHFECQVKNGWNRSESGDVETVGGNIHWIGNATDSLFDFGQFCFGVNFKNIVVNGRDTLKLAYDATRATPSVLRDYYFENCGAINCDFGAVMGGLTGTDLAPVTWINPIFNKNKSAALAVNSGNATVTLIGGFITNNGYAPSVGNAFISDSINKGYQLLNVAGHLSTLNITLDASPSFYAASGKNVRIISGSAHLDGWDDTPEVISVEIISGVEHVDFGKWRHYDGSMTKDNTPTSIIHQADFCLSAGSNLAVFGDIELVSGAQAGFNDQGVVFFDSSSGFTGSAVGLGGLKRVTQSGFNEVVESVGGDIIRNTGTFPASQSIHCRNNGVLIAKRARAANSVIVTESMDSAGRLTTYTNAYRDANTAQEKSISAGVCVKTSVAGNGDWTFSVASASTAGEVLVFSTKFGVRDGQGSNGKKKIVLDGNELSYDLPASGQVSRGSVYFKTSATPGGKAAHIVTTSGTVGSTAVIKEFGTINE